MNSKDKNSYILKNKLGFPGGSVVRIPTPVQETWVCFMIQEGPMCHGAARHLQHSCWAGALETSGRTCWGRGSQHRSRARWSPCCTTGEAAATGEKARTVRKTQCGQNWAINLKERVYWRGNRPGWCGAFLSWSMPFIAWIWCDAEKVSCHFVIQSAMLIQWRVTDGARHPRCHH